MVIKKNGNSFYIVTLFMPEWSGAYCFCPVCLFVWLSVVNFNIRYNF